MCINSTSVMLYQRASQKHGSKEFVIVDCQVDAAQKCGIDVERLVKQRLRRTSFVSKHIKGSEKTDGGVGKQNEFSNQLTQTYFGRVLKKRGSAFINIS